MKNKALCFLLILYGSTIKTSDRRGSSAASVVTTDLASESELLLLPFTAPEMDPVKNPQLLFKAIEEKDISTFNSLLRSQNVPIDIWAHSTDLLAGMPLLSVAVCANLLDAVELLLERGANVNIADNKYGDRPLHCAARFCSRAIEPLLRRRARINVKSDCGATPLHQAAGDNNIDALKVLLANGADMNIADNEGNGPLHYAVNSHAGARAIELSLLKQGADMNGEGRAMLVANEAVRLLVTQFDVNKNQVVVVDLLLAYGANPELRNAQEKTPLDLARSSANQEIIALLENAQRRLKDNSGCSNCSIQ